MADFLSKEQRSALMGRVGVKNTRPEMFVRKLLHRAGYRFRLHNAALPGTPDIVLPRYRTAVFVHGCFWHGHDCRKGTLPKSNAEFWEAKIAKNRERDRRHFEALQAQGWRVLVAWECDLTAAGEEILAALSTKKGPK